MSQANGRRLGPSSGSPYEPCLLLHRASSQNVREQSVALELTMGKHATKLTSIEAASNVTTGKRKRDELPELEVNVLAPEPLSKKTLRKSKKDVKQETSFETAQELSSKDKSDLEAEGGHPSSAAEQINAAHQSGLGIWIGNLPWSTNKNDLRQFISQYAQIDDKCITRIHMPTPSNNDRTKTAIGANPRNKGFAYVDFTDHQSLKEALKLSDKYLGDRRVLIKEAQDFSGRPDPVDQKGGKNETPRLPPNTRVFVGNLGFDTTHDELWKHLEQCGELADLHLATFEDSGKCKGFAWAAFKDLASASAAERGFIMVEPETEAPQSHDSDRQSERASKKARPRKWWVNKLHGRSLRVEYAEDQATRYKKRFGKGKSLTDGFSPSKTLLQAHDQSHPSEEHDQGRKPYQSRALRKVENHNAAAEQSSKASLKQGHGIHESSGKKIVFT